MCSVQPSYLVYCISFMETGAVFRKLGLWTVVAVYLLIAVGSVVRATGAGMGCPDWPKCFGSWVPPTSVEQLPVNYEQIFGAKLKGEVVFNPVKTWTEYVNRLVGVLIGFLIFGTFVSAYRTYRKKDKTIVWLSFLAFFLVCFEGWLGAKVVSFELLPIIVTVHMLLAVVIVFILLYAVSRSYNGVVNIEDLKNQQSIHFLLLIMMFLSIGQLLLGTQVREAVDVVLEKYGRSLTDDWLGELGGKFYFHIVLSIILLLIHVVYQRQVAQNVKSSGIITKLANYLLFVVVLEIVSGGILSLFQLPAFAQPIHLTFSVIILGLQFVSVLLINKEFVFKSAANAQTL